MAVTRRSNEKAPGKEKWTWGYDDFDSQEEVEAAIAEAIFFQVIGADEELSDPQGAAWDVEIVVRLVPRENA